ncbi:transferrin-a [Eucyclogobius newberryi]|uniref:transferrin-a n=1 Tax=Eucyclogobius newberryi TaxID=166745 RepID=UPI003B5A937E
MQPLLHVALLCCLATVFAVPTVTVKWCVISELELLKCQDLAKRSPVFSCVQKSNTLACIVAIKAGEADAITLKGGDIYTAGLNNYDLAPIIAEEYTGANADTCIFSVAVAKQGTGFGLKDLRGKKSCHTGLGDPEGWNLPIGTLLSHNVINWAGVDNEPLLKAVSEFFSASCVPGAQGYPNLCQLCKDCTASSTNDYYSNAGAFKCLAEDAGQVAFMNPTKIPAFQKNNYELLCQDNTRQSVDNYKNCNLGREPAHAVVTRKDGQLTELIWTSLTTVRGFNLFSSEQYGGKDLMFSDATSVLRQVPAGTDSFLYLGAEYMSKIYSLLRDSPSQDSNPTIKWCAVGHAEVAKCDVWSGNTITDTGNTAVECQSAPTVEDCFKKIMRQEADAMAVDGGQVYTAGKCGLVPVMAEQYEEAKCGSPGVATSSYYSVAVIKKGSGVTWGNLKGKKSCHTGMSRTAGWNIPMGLIHKETNNCDFTQFFSSGCAPGAELTSPFCSQCKGSGKTVGDDAKCKASADELYYGYAGAFRCLVEDAGDVAFIKHTIVGENTNGHGPPEWASGLRSEDFELICPGNNNPVPITDYESCNLALVPAHAVITRPESQEKVIRVLLDQQAKFGTNGNDDKFRMFQSENGKNLLFKDSTKCLQAVGANSFETFLGPNYMTAMNSLRICSALTPDLEKSCTFQTCKD